MPATSPPYPYDHRTHTITLPASVAHETFHLAREAGKAEAVKQVMELTGAGLKVAKDYVDALLQAR